MPRSLTRSDAVAAACCVFYFALGVAWIDQPGIQADEALFAQPLFDATANAESISIFHHQVPLMIMSYLGCLKTLFYAPALFFFSGNTAALIRVPMVAAGALTIWIIYCILSRLHSAHAGVIAAILLASDTLYLWLSRCDWGPVTLQHLLAAGGVWMLLQFRDHQRRWGWLAGGFFLFGLALWDKTVFLWPAAALITGAAFLWRDIRPLVTPRRALLALAFLILGAFPWIRHNVRQHGATFNETGHFSTADIWTKSKRLVDDLNEVSLLGFMIRERGAQAEPQDALARTTVAVARALNFPQQAIGGWVFLACFAAALFLGRTSRIAVGMMAAGFGLMALTQGGGYWSYHAVVLWPLPQVVMAVVLVRLPKPWLIAAVGAIALPALAVTNTHFALLHLYGGSTTWTDAIYRLPAAIERHQTPAPAQVIDWGILESVQLLTRGKLPIRMGIDRPAIVRGTLYIGHAAGAEVFPDSNTRLEADARAAACQLRTLETIADRRGTPIYQIQACE